MLKNQVLFKVVVVGVGGLTNYVLFCKVGS